MRGKAGRAKYLLTRPERRPTGLSQWTTGRAWIGCFIRVSASPGGGGYQANYSNHTPGFIKVLDPVMVLTHGGGHRTDYLPITLHPTQVHRFISERS